MKKIFVAILAITATGKKVNKQKEMCSYFNQSRAGGGSPATLQPNDKRPFGGKFDNFGKLIPSTYPLFYFLIDFLLCTSET